MKHDSKNRKITFCLLPLLIPCTPFQTTYLSSYEKNQKEDQDCQKHWLVIKRATNPSHKHKIDRLLKEEAYTTVIFYIYALKLDKIKLNCQALETLPMRMRKRTSEPPNLRDIYLSKPLERPVEKPVIVPLRFWEHWVTVAHMFRNYHDVDPVFERIMGGKLMTPISRIARGPFYYWILNTGFGLRLGNKLAGQIYLQHKNFLTHINDIEINEGFRGLGLSHQLMNFAEEEARKRGYSFLTLGVTNTNRRAINLYLKTGYLEQHHKYYYLSRPAWADPPDTTAYMLPRKNIYLQPLKSREARRSLNKFFNEEQRASNPETAPVWESFYQPKIPTSGKGVSFSIHFGQNKPSEGHADFFDWGERGRWRIYLNPERWGTPEEKTLLELVINQARGFTYQWVSLGSQKHHDKALPLTNSLGLVERNGERMLMVKLLN